MKKILFLLMCLINTACFAATANLSLLGSCGHAVPHPHPNFCASFKAIAYCHCHDEHGMPPTACNDMNRILQIMIATYGNLWNACSSRAQNDVPQQECFDDWNFYINHCQ